MKKDLKKLFERIEKGQISQEDVSAQLNHLTTNKNDQRFEQKAMAYFHKSLANAMKLPVAKVDIDLPLEEYGMDSVMVISMTDKLEEDFGSLSKTLLYEHQTIRELAQHFVAHHRATLESLLGLNATSTDKTATKKAPTKNVTTKKVIAKKAVTKPVTANKPSVTTDIAIIGISGRYPKAANLDEYWHNLKFGVDCITEVPSDRWDHSLYYDEDKSKAGKTYLKWGGFIDGVDQFDPLFFGISPREAQRMDPQDRLFLQCAYEVIEDAGYTKETLAKAQTEGAEIGVYVGVMYEEYQLYGAQSTILGDPQVMSGNPASIANRVSYYCNFHGPSMTVDTMCSSSLTTIHLACQSIFNGECSLAIAGGVNVSVHPNKFMLLGMGRFASSVGRCGSFGEGGDGYVPGEGVGAVLLKPLAEAQASHDHIYGVIKGSSINHGGKTNGYTVPNPKSQHQVIARALTKSGVPARAISYIEAHGTGTSLGDPIEISGLTKAFTEQTDERQFCAIGSAKSNIGHCESAAGIAGLTKVLLQMRHGQIVPSLHSSTLNPNIDFDKTPFSVQQQLTEWPQPLVDGKTYPRVAGISSFGAGGSNAHIVIEEYQNEVSSGVASGEVLILLSAKTTEALAHRAQDLLKALDGFSDSQLTDIAYTLQVGREAMSERLALVVDSIDSLKHKLQSHIDGEQDIEGVYVSHNEFSKDVVGAFKLDEDLELAVNSWIEKGKLDKLAEFWLRGVDFDWQQLYSDGKPNRVSLPVYRFAKERFWLDLPSTAFHNQTEQLHPLLHRNTSTLNEQRYSTLLTGDEYYLADHQVQGQKILPAAVQLEIAREAIERSLDGLIEGERLALNDIAFVRPMVVEQPLTIHVSVVFEEDESLSFCLYSDIDDDELIYCQGGANLVDADEVNLSHDLTALQASCIKTLSVTDSYQRFAKVGLNYGAAMQPLVELYQGVLEQQKLVLAKLNLPQAAKRDAEHFVMNPSLLDGSLQAAIALVDGAESENQTALPFAIETLNVYQPLPEQVWSVIRTLDDGQSSVQKLDIEVVDANGQVCVSLKGFTSRVLKSLPSAKAKSLLLAPKWTEKALVASSAQYTEHHVLLCDNPQAYLQATNKIESQIKGARCHVLHSTAGQSVAERYQAYAQQLLLLLQKIAKQQTSGQVLLQLVVPATGEAAVLEGLAGMLKTAALENNRLHCQVLSIDAGNDLVSHLQQEAMGSHQQIRFVADRREVLSLVEASRLSTPQKPWRDNGVYLITGGTKGLGLLFANTIAEQVEKPTLILTSRSPLNDQQQQKIAQLAATGALVQVLQNDVTVQAQVNTLIEQIKQTYGELNGVIHSAGVLKDGMLRSKTVADLADVLAPKVNGVVYLDEATRDCALECFIVFSSISGITGNVGQSDYAAANAFMDAYANYRNTLVANQLATGRTLSVNWPLWADGGMQVDEATRQFMWQNLGMVPLETAVGIDALLYAWGLEQDFPQQLLTVQGNNEQIKSVLEVQSHVEPVANASTIEKTVEKVVVQTSNHPSLASQTEAYIKQAFSDILQLPVEQIDVAARFDDYGIDSVVVMDLTNTFEQQFGVLPKTLFFEYLTVSDLCGYFVANHSEKLSQLFDIKDGPTRVISNKHEQSQEQSITNKPTQRLRSKRRGRIGQIGAKKQSQNDIAIIGISGRYPGAQNLNEYWHNLASGTNSISEIPKHRWDHNIYFSEDKNQPGKSYAKWGGFIDGIEHFDPLFFNISPREAVGMDPQERLFLQCVYAAIEDAGYTWQSFGQTKRLGVDANVGVYVGVMYEEYQLYAAQAQQRGEGTVVGGNASSVANRISHYCNFHGPSMAIDTMCSSSLTAIHLACEAIARGNCEQAIAGGVNLSVHPNKFLLLSQGRFASSDGLCRSFGEGGDGYVPGEGVGAVLLKPLTYAEQDNDHIYGIIKATAINHGGKTNGYTVPNPNAQHQVIARALKQSAIPARAISYIEAHGTGTSLGDPIEISGLTKAFGAQTDATQYCAIGSAKSNIGHCESAAGVAGLSKVLLQMRHGKLVPSLHSATLNPNIDFATTPFTVQQQLTDWPRPVIDGKEYPRIAGVSSFGAGGSNAHILIEEYRTKTPARTPAKAVQHQQQALIVLSAKTLDALKARAADLLASLGDFSDAQLADIAYTLQVGREAMSERVAFVADTLASLATKLEAYVNENSSEHQSSSTLSQDMIGAFKLDEDLEQAVINWIEKGKLAKLADFWCRGVELDWQRLYLNVTQLPARVSLPSYQFAKEGYWVETSDRFVTSNQQTAYLHPVLHRNTSNLHQQRFTTVFTGDEYYLADHQVQGEPVLPGVVQLEMAREAITQSLEGLADSEQLQLKNIAFVRPLSIEQAKNVHVSVVFEQDASLSFAVFSDEDIVHTQGRAIFVNACADTIDLAAAKSACDLSISAVDCYQQFADMGLHYGAAMQPITELYSGQLDGKNAVLSQLELPQSANQDASQAVEQFVLNPSLLDGCLQSAIGLFINDKGKSNETSLPFAIESLTIHQALPTKLWSVIRREDNGQSDIQKLNVDVCDEQGQLCVRIEGFTSRVLKTGKPQVKPAALIAEPVWKTSKLQASESQYKQHWVLLCDHHQFKPSIEQQGARCLLLAEDHNLPLNQRYQQSAEQLFAFLQQLLINKVSGKTLLQLVVPQSGEGAIFAGLAGMLKSAAQENSKLQYQMIATDNNVELVSDLFKERGSNASQVRYVGNDRQELILTESSASSVEAQPWRSHGVYLITGGTKGLGLLFAETIAKQVASPTLILTGRSALNAEQQSQVAQLEALGATVQVVQNDVSQQAPVVSLIGQIKAQHGELNGIIHSAGVLRDSMLLKKSADDLATVLAPKVDGVVYLDEASRDCALECFILFSSISGLTGNMGQTDYACANAFMDNFAHYRNQQVSSGLRKGQTLSINWPLWAQGGMQVDEATRKFLWNSLGMVPLETEVGIDALKYAWGFEKASSQLLIVQGDNEQLKNVLKVDGAVSQTVTPAPTNTPAPVSADLSQKVYQYLRQLVAQVIELPIERLSIDKGLDSYGIDSILVMKLTDELEKSFSGLSQTIFFEHQTIKALGGHLIEHHNAEVKQLFAETVATEKTVVASSTNRLENLRSRLATSVVDATVSVNAQPVDKVSQDIAVIGMAGRYAQSANLAELWDNLSAGNSCISKVPTERWDHSAYYSDERAVAGKSYTQWAGFMSGIDEFDPLFFNISPRETEYIDPQERLFLQEVYACIEDAGYTPSSLDKDNNVAVYVGVMNGRYDSGAQYWSIANRVSYIFDFHGPSFALDSACSSSLTAMHLAMENLQAAQSACAIVGGVNLIVNPQHLVVLSGANMLSAGPKCRSFGDGADGFVDGEGVGALLLKPLTQAQIDRDNIYGVLKASAINHGGKTNGYTVPNPTAHTQVISQAIEKAGVPVRAISYIEAHGTGTPLGDPIEITGLTRAFTKLGTIDKQFCAIGSIKSNLGHCESAAGVAGVSKLLLQLQHRQIAPSLHSSTLNPKIDFAQSPFVVQQQLQPWQRPLIIENGVEVEYPRTAGISSFGAGGSNAHIIVQEIAEQYTNQTRQPTVLNQPALIVLSAKTQTALLERASRLLTLLPNKVSGSIHDLAYTLQVGREPMKERLALVVDNFAQLSEALNAFVNHQTSSIRSYQGRVKQDQDGLGDVNLEQQATKAIADAIGQSDWSTVLEYWVQGASVDWSLLYADVTPLRISLPTYPFARQSYWSEKPVEAPAASVETPKVLHPLLHENVSQLNQQRFETTLTGQAFFLADHQVQGMKILPCVAQLEMATEAIKRSVVLNAADHIRLSDVAFIQPIIVAASLRLSVSVEAKDNGAMKFVISAEQDGAQVLYTEGRAHIINQALSAPLAIDTDTADIKQSLTPTHCYDKFASMGIVYGPGMQALFEVHLGQDSQGEFVMAELELPQNLALNGFTMHPSLMDASLQAAIGFVDGAASSDGAMVPFSVEQLACYQPLPSQVRTLLRVNTNSTAEVRKLDIDLCTLEGEVCVSMKGFSTRLMRPATSPTIKQPPVIEQPDIVSKLNLKQQPDTLMLALNWDDQTLEQSDAPYSSQENEQHVVVLVDEQFDKASVEAHLPNVICHQLVQDSALNIAEHYQTSAVQLLKLLQQLSTDESAPQQFIQVVVQSTGDKAVLNGLAAMLKTAEQENNQLLTQLVALDSNSDLVNCLKLEYVTGARAVRYIDSQRQVLNLVESLAEQGQNKPTWVDNGVYLIAGGTGHLGLAVAEDIARSVNNPTLVLIARSPLSSQQREKLTELVNLGARVEFEPVDITDFDQVSDIVAIIDHECGQLNGVIHCAGANDELFKHQLIADVDTQTIDMSVKINGIVNLDLATKHHQLDCFIGFSSIAAVMGNAGQAVFATANAFMDAYITHRNVGRSLTINWPQWQHTGHDSEQLQLPEALWSEMAMTLLTPDAACRALKQAWQGSSNQLMVLSGLNESLRAGFGLPAIESLSVHSQQEPQVATVEVSEPQTIEQATDEAVDPAALTYFQHFIADYLKLPYDLLDVDERLDNFGIDSVMVMSLLSELEKDFGEQPKTLFFEYQSVRELAGYFQSEFKSQLDQVLSTNAV